MRDGQRRRRAPGRRLRPITAWSRPWAAWSREQARSALAPRDSGQRRCVDLRRSRRRACHFAAHAGEIVGLAGLGGHGQTEMLLALFARRSGDWLPSATATTSPSSPATASLTASSRSGPSCATSRSPRSADLSPRGLIVARRRGGDRRRLEASGSASARPTSTTRSCRCPAATSRRCCSPARSATPRADRPDGRSDARRRCRHQAGGLRHAAQRGRGGRTFIWYSTEMDESASATASMSSANGRIVAELAGDEITEEKVLPPPSRGPPHDVPSAAPTPSACSCRRCRWRVLLAAVFWLQPRAMSYVGLNLLFNLAVPIALATIAQMLDHDGQRSRPLDGRLRQLRRLRRPRPCCKTTRCSAC